MRGSKKIQLIASRSLPPRWAISMIWTYRVSVILALATLLVAGVALLAVALVVRQLVDYGLVDADPWQLDRVVLVLLGLVVLYATLTLARAYLTEWIGDCVVADLRTTLFDRLIALEPAYFETHSIGELLSRITLDAAALQTLTGSLLSVARSSLIVVAGTGMLFAISAKLLMVALLAVSTTLLPILKLGSYAVRLSRESQAAVAKLTGYAEEAFNALPEMRPEPLVRPFLIRAHQTRVPRHIGGKDRGEAADRRHLSRGSRFGLT